MREGPYTQARLRVFSTFLPVILPDQSTVSSFARTCTRAESGAPVWTCISLHTDSDCASPQASGISSPYSRYKTNSQNSFIFSNQQSPSSTIRPRAFGFVFRFALCASGQSATRICFLGLYKELPQLECYLDVFLEADSCRGELRLHGFLPDRAF